MQLSIRYKLLLAFALVLSVSALVYTISFKITRDYVSFQIGALQLEKAQSAADRVAQFISTTESLHLSFVQSYEELDRRFDQNLINIVDYSLQSNPHIRQVTFLSPAGRELLKIEQAGPVENENLNFEIPTPAFDMALGGQFAISKVYFPPGLTTPSVSLFSPILSNEQTVLGILKSEIDLSQLWELISQTKLGAQGFAYVLDEEARLVAHPNQELVAQRPDLSDRKVVRAILDNQPDTLKEADYVYRDESGTEVVARGLKIPEIEWIVMIEQPAQEAFTFLNFSRNLFYLTFGGSLVLLIIIALFLSENLTRPILKLKAGTELLKRGQLDTQVSIKSGDEIEALADSFNVMAERLLLREHSLQAEKSQMEKLLQSLTDGVLAIDQSEKILLFNKAAEQITGLKAEDILGKELGAAIPFYQLRREITLHQYRQQMEGKTDSGPIQAPHIIDQDGKEVFLTLNISPVEFEQRGHTGWIITFQDVTKEQELEEMKLDFVAMAAHELRTPLTAIRGYLDILHEELGDRLQDQEKTFLQRSIISSQQLSTLVENLLNVSRIEKGELKLDLRPESIEHLTESAVRHLSDLAREKGIQLEYHQPEQPLTKIEVDQFRIGEVLSNLISNAIQYTPEKGQIDIKLEEKDDRILVHVQDNGQGIPADSIQHLFTKFYRVTGHLAQGSKGTGLGLFITKAIIEAHHGNIWVESKLGEGSTFSFSLPKTKS